MWFGKASPPHSRAPGNRANLDGALLNAPQKPSKILRSVRETIRAGTQATVTAQIGVSSVAPELCIPIVCLFSIQRSQQDSEGFDEHY